MLMLLAIQQEVQYHKNKIDIDENIIYKIAQGDKSAFEKLYYLTDKAVFGFALSIVKNKYDAEDIMQDTYLQIRRYAGSYKAQNTPMAWILTITKHLAFAKLKQPSNTQVDIETQFSLADSANTVEEIENSIVLKTLLNTLTDEERRVVILHAQTGMKHREIADILSLPLSTVLSRYNRALKKMNSALKD